MQTPRLDREEYVEQVYFFRVMRERISTGAPAQEILGRLHEEILTTTRLPLAIQFLATELRHTGSLASGFLRLSHYFTHFQAFVIQCTENERLRFNTDIALLILERMAGYLAEAPVPTGLFVFQFEAMSRNKLGYDLGLEAMAADPFFDEEWRGFLTMVRQQLGVVDFADLVYLRSRLYVMDQQRTNPGYEAPVPPLFGEKEGKIAKASRGRDPLYLFSALQRQLNYPEVPRPKPRDDLAARVETLQARIRDLESRLKLIESELRGQVDLSQFGTPEMFKERLRDEDDRD